MTRSLPYRHVTGLHELLLDASAKYRRRSDAAAAELLEKAVEMVPYRTDILLDLASCHLHLNAVDAALECYKQALAVSPGDAEALSLLGHWSRFSGNMDEAATALEKLNAVRPARAADMARIWQAIDDDAGQPVTDFLPDGFRKNGGGQAIVILGYVLSQDGSMHQRLVDRLEKTREAAVRFPDSCIVATGGVPKSGKVEAVEMRNWLVRNGIAEERIHDEGNSRDIVENIVYSRDILDSLSVGAALFVTSAINVRRTRLIARVVAWSGGSVWLPFVVAAKMGSDRYDSDCGTGDFKTYRDIIRAYGIPLMHAYPELVSR